VGRVHGRRGGVGYAPAGADRDDLPDAGVLQGDGRMLAVTFDRIQSCITARERESAVMVNGRFAWMPAQVLARNINVP